MNFKSFLDQAWADHGQQEEAVASRLVEGIALLDNSEQIPQLGQIVVHVFGQHLGRWKDGIETLLKIESSSLNDEKSLQALKRCQTVLKFCQEEKTSVDNFDVSEKIKIFAMASSALCDQGQIDRSGKVFLQAIQLAENLDQTDPANQSLAVTGNSLSYILGKLEKRTPEQELLMINSALESRKFWEIAGDWMNVERGEYQISVSYLKANKLVEAKKHAKRCLDICTKNQAEPLELFFAFEAQALVENKLGNSEQFDSAFKSAKANFEKISEKDQKWCRETLDKLTQLKTT